MGSIQTVGVNTMVAVSTAVQDTLNTIQAMSQEIGTPGSTTTPEEFQAHMLKLETKLDMLKKIMDTVEQAVRSFHKE